MTASETRQRASVDNYPRLIDLQGERCVSGGLRLWIVDEGALREKKNEAERGVNQGGGGASIDKHKTCACLLIPIVAHSRKAGPR